MVFGRSYTGDGTEGSRARVVILAPIYVIPAKTLSIMLNRCDNQCCVGRRWLRLMQNSPTVPCPFKFK